MCCTVSTFTCTMYIRSSQDALYYSMFSHCSSCQASNLRFVDSVFTMDVLGVGINLCVLFGEGILFAILTYLLEVSKSTPARGVNVAVGRGVESLKLYCVHTVRM